jgi:hypothetical protein
MNGIIWIAIHLHAWLICLYPLSFRGEYGTELDIVFSESLTDAAARNKRTVLIIILRELRDYPISLLREHWRSLTHQESNRMTVIKKPEWFFFPIWIILQVLSIIITFGLTLVILKVIITFVGSYIYVDGVQHITEDYLFMRIVLPAYSLITGLLQYGLLRRYIPHMGWWVLATAGGWLLGVVLISGLSWITALLWPNKLIFDSRAVDSGFILLGFSVGIGQWFLLRRRLPRAGWWIIANMLGWGLLSLITGPTLDQYDLLLVGLLPGSVTAAALFWLMGQVQLAKPQEV